MSSELERVFFVVGRGRSGTTLLSRMLTRHPSIEVAPEGFFVMNLRRRYARGRWSVARVDAFCRDLVVENRMRTWQLDLADVRRRLLSDLERLDFRRACVEVYMSYAQVTCRRTDIVRVGDKNPHYGIFSDRLVAMFPHARFIHITRDPRDNVMSYQKVPFDLTSTAALAYRWARYNRELLAVAARHPDNFLRIRYEDLVSDPVTCLTAVCKFLNVGFDERMLSFHEQAPDGFYGEGSAWFAQLDKPLDADQARKWEGRMPAAAVSLIEAVAADLMKPLGYTPVHGPIALSASDRLQVGMGWGSVAAEKAVFGMIPAQWRIRFINAYRARTGRV